jgi:hypothetical protein
MVRRIAALAVAAALVLSASALAATAGTYTGKTSQKKTISLTVAGGAVTKLKYVADFGSCGSNLSGSLTRKIKIGTKGHFTATSHKDGTLKISGTFKGKSVRGSFSASFVEGGIHGSHLCKTGKVSYTATRK